MVYLYYCSACEKGKHSNCELSHPSVPPGSFGGTKCRCPCNRDPSWDTPETIHQTFEDSLNAIVAFENASKGRNIEIVPLTVKEKIKRLEAQRKDIDAELKKLKKLKK